MLNTLSMILQLVVGLIIIIPLIYFTLKYGGKKFQTMQNNNYLKVLERISFSKENSLIVVKIGEKAFVFTSTNSNIEMLMEIDKEDIEKIEKSKVLPEYNNINEFLKDFKKKFHIKDKNELLKKLKIKKEG